MKRLMTIRINDPPNISLFFKEKASIWAVSNSKLPAHCFLAKSQLTDCHEYNIAKNIFEIPSSDRVGPNFQLCTSKATSKKLLKWPKKPWKLCTDLSARPCIFQTKII